MEDDRQRRERLPPAVYDLALRLGVDPRLAATDVRLRQSGRMRPDADSSWTRFDARQVIRAERCVFDWRARTGPAGLVEVRDALVAGQGRVRVTALGFIRLGGAGPSPAATRGELMRYLAELAWAPAAILFNPALSWRVVRPDRIVVGAGSGEAAAQVELRLNGEGRIAEAFAADRPRIVKAGFEPTPWRGRFSEYRRRGGFWLPYVGAVGWIVKGESPNVWEGRLTGWAPEAQGTTRGL